MVAFSLFYWLTNFILNPGNFNLENFRFGKTRHATLIRYDLLQFLLGTFGKKLEPKVFNEYF
jgi:hypothetical protein